MNSRPLIFRETIFSQRLYIHFFQAICILQYHYCSSLKVDRTTCFHFTMMYVSQQPSPPTPPSCNIANDNLLECQQGFLSAGDDGFIWVQVPSINTVRNLRGRCDGLGGGATWCQSCMVGMVLAPAAVEFGTAINRSNIANDVTSAIWPKGMPLKSYSPTPDPSNFNNLLTNWRWNLNNGIPTNYQ